jgi:hypothetical protein
MIMFGSFLPSRLVGQHHQLYSGKGADIVMESIAQVTAQRIPVETPVTKSALFENPKQ